MTEAERQMYLRMSQTNSSFWEAAALRAVEAGNFDKAVRCKEQAQEEERLAMYFKQP